MALASKDLQHEANSSRLYLNTYYSQNSVLNKQAVFGFALVRLRELFEQGGIKGKILISLGFGAALLQVMPACEHFDEIYLTTNNEANVAEYHKWLQKEPDAFDWTPLMKQLWTSEGNVAKYADLERTLRANIKQCLTFDMTKSNPFHPVVLPAADCVMLYFFLGPLGKDKETCVKYLRKAVAQIKDGGHLVIYAVFGMSFFTIGQHRVPCFSYDQHFVRLALDEVDYEIHDFSCRDREGPSDTRYCDYKKVAIFAARKKSSV
ncbi:indolethylamine N-methyltransferase-like [Lissotriton helveticus]